MSKLNKIIKTLPFAIKPCKMCGELPTIKDNVLAADEYGTDFIFNLECRCMCSKQRFLSDRIDVLRAVYHWNTTIGREDFPPIIPFDTLEFVRKAHDGQFRKGGEFYYFHPYRVAFDCIDFGYNDIDVINAALLHDVLEDTSTTIETYNERVQDIVKALTKPPVTAGNRKQRHILYFNQLSNGPQEACFIKLVDILDNAKTIACVHSADFVKLWKSEAMHYVKELPLERHNEWLRGFVRSFL